MNKFTGFVFTIHLLLLFAIASGVMRSYLFFFKIFIPTPYYWQINKFNRNDHSLSFAVFVGTCCYHSLSLFIILCTARCHSLSLSLFSFFIKDLRKTSKDQKKSFECAVQKECFMTKLKMLKENEQSCFMKLSL